MSESREDADRRQKRANGESNGVVAHAISYEGSLKKVSIVSDPELQRKIADQALL